MSVKAKSEGQALIERIADFLSSYLVFPSEHYAMICALWALNTWFFERFDAVGYLAVTAETKRAGKTTLLELLSFLTRNAERIGAATRTDTLYGVIAQYDSRCTLYFDEAERMSSSTASIMRAMMNAGYRRGEYVFRKLNKVLVKLGCYCPKLFALIGDPTDTLRDRSILIVMRRAASPKPYRPTTAELEAAGIRAEIKRYLDSGALANLAVVAPEWLQNRDQEVWESLWSIVCAMGCDREFVERFQRASADMVAVKSAPIKRYVEVADSEEKQMLEDYGEVAIRDLAKVFKEGESAIFAATAVERMRALPTAPWREFRGVGLNEVTLANMLRRFGVRPGRVREVKGKGAREAEQRRGYSLKSVRASVPVKG